MSTHPPTFENYPAQPQDRVDPEPAPGQPPAQYSDWTPTAPATPPNRAPGPSRRTLILATVIGVAGVVAVPLLARRPAEDWDPEADPQAADPGDPSTDETDQDGTLVLENYTVSYPAGWVLTDEGERSAKLSNGAVTASFLVYRPTANTRVVAEATRLLSRHAASLRRPGPVGTRNDSTTTLDIGVAHRPGTVNDLPVQAEAWVAIDEGTEWIVAMITVVPDGTSARIRRELASMRKELLDEVD